MIIATNKKVYHEYTILDILTAGIVLSGPEVKSVKLGHIDLKGSFAVVEQEEVWLKNAYIAPYKPAKHQQINFDPYQNRKLLLNKKEINFLIGKTKERGVTLVPLKITNKNGLIKIELGLGKGKTKYDKRESIKKREFNRKKERMLKN